MTDILTDLSFLQRPATPKASEQTVATRKAKAVREEATRQMQTILESALASLKANDATAALQELRQLGAAGEVLERAAAEERAVLERAQPQADLVGASNGEALQPYEGAQPMVHNGFYTALNSVLPRLLRLLPQLTDGGGGGWTVCVTGHSLGGALATLMAWEIEALREKEFPQIAEVVLYNFGSPRVGNGAFADSFDRAISTAFRVVNRDDVVARVPNYKLPGGEWSQVGRTVLVRSDADAEGALWVQGEMAGVCPISLDAGDVTAEEAKLAKAEAKAEGKASGVGGRMKLLRSAFGGQGVGDHLEDAYHAGMGAAVTSWVVRKQLEAGGAAGGASVGALGDAAAAAAPAAVEPAAVIVDAEVLSGIDTIVKEEVGLLLRRADTDRGAAAKDASVVLVEDGASASSSTTPSSASASDDAGALVERIKARAIADTRTLTGKDQYEVGDISRAVASSLRRELSARLSSGEWDLEDLSLLLRTVLLLGAKVSPGVCACACARVRVRVCACVCVCACACARARVRVCACVCACARVRVRVCACAHACACACPATTCTLYDVLPPDRSAGSPSLPAQRRGYFLCKR